MSSPEETPLEFQSLRLEKQTLSQIEFFFTEYNKLYGKKFKVLGTAGRKKADNIVRRATKWYLEQ